MPENILEIRNLRVSFSDPDGPEKSRIQAVSGVNLDIQRGSFTALVGESGSGKSVTALSVGKLLRGGETEGEVRFYGSTRLTARGRGISYVFQDPASSLNPVLRVGRQIEEAGKNVLQALVAAQITDAARVAASFPHELSGGMKQRAMIAMALVSEPDLLIADEPTTALDVSVEFEIMELLARLRRERSLSVLFITHNLPLAMRYADTIHVMERGRVVESLIKRDGSFDEPRGPYTRRLFSAELLNQEPKSYIGS